jgi:hypothetical protein
MSYEEFFELFKEEIAAVGLVSEFSASWLARLKASLPQGQQPLHAPEFAFFVTAIQVYADFLADRDAFHCFMQNVAATVSWIKTKPRGGAGAKRLAQASLDGPLSALFEIYTAWRLDSAPSARLAELEPKLLSGKTLDARIDVKGAQLLVECYASLTSDLATSGAFNGYWTAQKDPAMPKIRNKILDKADQASSSTLPVVLFIAPSADFVIPCDKIPHAVSSAFAEPKAKRLSAVVFTGGSHTYLCHHVELVFENRNAALPLTEHARKLLGSLKRS